MKILVIAKDQSTPTLSRVKEESFNLDCQLQFFNPEHYSQISPLTSQLSSSPPDLILNRYTSVNGNDFDLDMLSLYDDSLHINHPQGVRIARSKIAQIYQSSMWKLERVSLIPSLFIQGRPNESTVKTFLSSFDHHFIAKPIRSNGGKGITIFESKKSAFSFINTCYYINDQKFIVQPLINSQYEVRVLMVNFLPVLALKKMRKPDDWEFKNNLGPHTDLALISEDDLDSKILKDLKLMAQKLNLRLCAIDFLVCHEGGEQHDGHGQISLLEINPVPGWYQIEDFLRKNHLGPDNLSQTILKQMIE